MINYARVDALIAAALQLSMPPEVRALLSAAHEEMNPPPPPPDVPVADLPGVVLVMSGPFQGMYQHVRTGQVRDVLEGPLGMRDYVRRLAERDANLSAGPSFEEVWAKRQADAAAQPPQPEPPKPDDETPL